MPLLDACEAVLSENEFFDSGLQLEACTLPRIMIRTRHVRKELDSVGWCK